MKASHAIIIFNFFLLQSATSSANWNRTEQYEAGKIKENFNTPTILLAEKRRKDFSNTIPLTDNLPFIKRAEADNNYPQYSLKASPIPLSPRFQLTWDSIAKLMEAESELHNGNTDTALQKYIEVAEKTRHTDTIGRAVQLSQVSENANLVEWANRLGQLPEDEKTPSVLMSRTLSGILLKEKFFEQAFEHFRLIIQLEPDSEEPGANLSSFLSQKNMHIARNSKIKPIYYYAITHLDEKPLLGPKFSFVLTSLYPTLQNEDDGETVARITAELSTEYAENREAQILLAEVLAKKGDFEEALNVVEPLSSKTPGNLQLSVFLAQLYQRVGKAEKANQVFTRFIEDITPIDSVQSITAIIPYLFQATVLWASGELDQTASQLESIMNALERMEVINGIMDQSLKNGLNISLSKIAESQGKPGNAFVFYGKVVTPHLQSCISPLNPTPNATYLCIKNNLMLRASVLINMTRLDLLRHGNGPDKTEMSLVGIAKLDTMYNGQLQDLSHVMGMIGFNGDLNQIHWVTLLTLNYFKAQHDIKLELYHHLNSGTGERSDKVKTVESGVRTIDISPNGLLNEFADLSKSFVGMEVLYTYLDVANQLEGQPDPAIVDNQIDLIYSGNPVNPVILNGLGYLITKHESLYRYPNRLERAKNLIDRSLHLFPDYFPALDSKGWVLYRLGEYEQALEYLEKAMFLFPDGEVASHIGEVYWAMDNKEKARMIWNDAIDLEPENKTLIETMNRLDPQPSLVTQKNQQHNTP